MRPYGLVAFNRLKFIFLKITRTGFDYSGINMFSANSKFVLNKSSKVFFSDRIISDGRTVIIADKDCDLKIGKNVYFNEGLMISCKGKVTISDNCKFGPNVKIFDNNHKFDKMSGVSGKHSIGEVFIGDNCWIGANCVILKGTHIGKNSVIGAGCVIDRAIPDASIVTQGRELLIEQMK